MHLPFGLAARQTVRPEFKAATELRALAKRQQPPAGQTSPSNSNTTAIAVAAGVGIGFLVVCFILYYVLLCIRDKHRDPKYIPTQYLKKRWINWRSDASASYRHRTTDHLEPISETPTLHNRRTARVRSATPNSGTANARETQRAEPVGVDRNTSVRSVMTLPAYMPAPGEHEQVLGREGERGGVDVVLEHPESVSEIEEMRRDEEMEALYQVRLARRVEAAEREQLRRLRREARERGDYVALEELRARSRAADGARSERNLQELRDEHARLRDRPRAVSSVNYADVGVASHDGTRIRANSQESERPLLGDAASLASSRYHRRDRSASSVLSIDSDFPSPGLTRSRGNSVAESLLRRSSAVPSGDAMSSPELVDEVDVGDGDFPPHSPPEYENITLQDDSHVPTGAPPGYTSPIEDRGAGLPLSGDSLSSNDRTSSTAATGAPRLPSLRLGSVPSIVVDVASPVNRSEERPR